MQAWGNLIGKDEAKRIIMKNVIDPINNPNVDLKSFHHNFLLFGAKSTGKTFFMNKVHGILDNIPFLTIDCKFFSKDELDQLLSSAEEKENRVKIIYFKRIEKIEKRSIMIKNSFFKMIHCTQAYIFAETNKPFSLSKDLVSIFDELIYFPLPDINERSSFIQLKLKYLYHNVSNDELKTIAELAEHFTYSDLVILCANAEEYATNYQDDDSWRVNATCFFKALENTTPTYNGIDQTRFEILTVNYSYI